MAVIFLALGFFLQCVLNDLSSEFFRLIPFLCFFAAAATCFLRGVSVGGVFKIGLIDVLFLLFVFISILNFLVDLTPSPLLYSLLFVFVIYSVFYCLKSMGLNEFLFSYLLGLTAALILAIATDPFGLVDALMVVRSDNGLLRYMALGAHPNLVGHNFSIAALISFWFMFRVESFVRRAFSFLLGTSLLLLPVAASSRGSLVALFSSFGILIVYFYLSKDRELPVVRVVRRVTPFFLAILFVLIVLNHEYLWDLFELDTSSRGLDSGMSGRGDNWMLVIQDIFETPRNAIIGAGFRTWDDDVKGYATDNSYLNLAWEIGVPATLFAVMYFLRMLFLGVKSSYSHLNILAILMVSFMLLEGLVARYFFGMGNPSTCAFLAIMIYYESEISRSKFYLKFK